MEIQGEVSLASMVWLSQSSEAAVARALGAARPDAEWLLTGEDGARMRVRGGTVDVEPRVGSHWTGLVTGRVSFDGAAPEHAPFRPYALEPPPPPMRLESCWFALDRDGRVACFDRDTLGAAPMRRCWGPRPAPPATPSEPGALARELSGRHAVGRTPARAFTFLADADVFVREFVRGAPQSAARRWSIAAAGGALVVSATEAPGTGEPLPASFAAWLHSRGACRGCARSSLRDVRVRGAFVYAHRGRRRAAPYERVAEPNEVWSAAQACAALALSAEALSRSVLPVSFLEKDRLQPIEYVPCTWSETVPWESESGERHGET